jgi:two-component system response regulator FlrC
VTADVLIVEDDAALREALKDTLELTGLSVLTAGDGSGALALLDERNTHVVVSDVQMQPMDGLTLLARMKSMHPQVPVILMTAYATIGQAVEAMREGASDYLVKPFEAEVLISKVTHFVPQGGGGEEGMVAEDPLSRELLDLAHRVAASEATVMIGGESGTGKEVLARFIHRHSRRSGKPFVAINCAAIPDNMLEAVLFGYEKGSFTGAYKSSVGKFELAQGGTLLLDEISEMDLGLQAKLLRVLQEREVERLGGHDTIPLDIRVLATSNRDMVREVGAGRFREDLFYRLNVFPLHIPPLRERLADILPLAEYLAGRGARANGRTVPSFGRDSVERLCGHSWPGNVRELDNVIQRALILQAGPVIEPGDIRFEQVAGPSTAAVTQATPVDGDEGGLGDDLKAREKELIMTALQEGNGSRKLAAAKLGISPRTLRYKIQRLREAGISVPGSGSEML